MQRQPDVEGSNVHVLAQYESWVLVSGQEAHGSAATQQYFMVWLGDTPLDDRMVLACKKLAAATGVIPGLSFACKVEPEFGLVIDSKKGWGFETPELIQKTFENILWELNRFTRE